jgi:hypothetical protein
MLLADIKDYQRKRKHGQLDQRSPVAGQRSPAASAFSLKDGTRQVNWVPGFKYKLIRAGAVLTQHPETLYAQGLLQESNFFYFIHVDAFALRTGDKQNTKYMAVLQWNNVFIRPQFKYLQQCYADRKTWSQSESILADGTPYWCDIYLQHCRRKKTQP